MIQVLLSLSKSLRSALRWRVLLLLISPIFIFIMMLIILMWVGFGSLLGEIIHFMKDTSYFHGFATTLENFIDPGLVVGFLGSLLILTFAITASYAFASVMVSVFAMPLIYRWVMLVEYTHLEQKHGGSAAGSLFNALIASLGYLYAFFVTLPFWLIPGIGFVIPIALNAWLTKKIFVYDALEKFASRAERKLLLRKHSGELFLLGAALSVTSYIPLFFVLWPSFTALCYTHFALGRLNAAREAEAH